MHVWLPVSYDWCVQYALLAGGSDREEAIRIRSEG